MYGKVFETIYESTVADDWRALVTIQQLIVLADQKGQVHHSLKGLHRRTGIPMEVLEPGIEYLLSPDPGSQSKAEDGRRIIPLPEEDGRQPIGWQLINYEYYRDLGSRYESKDKTKKRVARHRQKKKKSKANQQLDIGESLHVTQSNGCNGNTDTDTDTDLIKKQIILLGVDLDTWEEFVEHRKEMKEEMTTRAKKMAIKILVELKKDGNDLNKVIRQSIFNGWKGLFAIKQDGPGNTGKDNSGGKLGRAAQAMEEYYNGKAAGDGRAGVVQDAGPTARLLPKS